MELNHVLFTALIVFLYSQQTSCVRISNLTVSPEMYGANITWAVDYQDLPPDNYSRTVLCTLTKTINIIVEVEKYGRDSVPGDSTHFTYTDMKNAASYRVCLFPVSKGYIEGVVDDLECEQITERIDTYGGIDNHNGTCGFVMSLWDPWSWQTYLAIGIAGGLMLCLILALGINQAFPRYTPEVKVKSDDDTSDDDYDDGDDEEGLDNDTKLSFIKGSVANLQEKEKHAQFVDDDLISQDLDFYDDVSNWHPQYEFTNDGFTAAD